MPKDKYHIYKLFILCEDLGGEIKPGMETLDVKWIDKDEKLDLSTTPDMPGANRFNV